MIHYIKISLLTVILVTFWTSCGGPELPTDFKYILENITNNCIIATYNSNNDQAKTLIIKLQEFKANRNSNTLESAKESWRLTRREWEKAEAFLFGPVKNQGFNISMDSWPLDEKELDSVIAGNKVLDKSFLDQQVGFIKGYHTIEYLLWGINSNKKVADFTEREIDYAIACAESLQGNTQKLYDYWRGGIGGDNFGKNLIEAGGRSIYKTQKIAILELVNGIIIVCDEVANSKLNAAYSKKDLALEESRYSQNSKNDFIDNVEGIKMIYMGKNGLLGDGSGISSIIKNLNPELDAKIINQIDALEQSISNIPGTYSDAVFNNRPFIETAITTALELQQTFTNDLTTELKNLP
ncbi:MAG: hypothetical protein KA797_03935 [Chitinophagales bacterium]|nr:hypothetical protein [Chitinophagales bacterium]